MIVLGPDEFRGADEPLLERVLEHRGMTLAIAAGEVQGIASAALLFSDFVVLTRDAVVAVDSAEALAAAVWRIGRGALRLHLLQGQQITADVALASGLADALVEAGTDPSEWAAAWTGGRSEEALDAAALLLRSRGGDRLEKAEFGRLFAAGVPQEGLDAFLAKRRPEWKRTLS